MHIYVDYCILKRCYIYIELFRDLYKLLFFILFYATSKCFLSDNDTRYRKTPSFAIVPWKK